MSEIIDSIEEDSKPELTKNWNQLQIVIAVFLLLTGGIMLWAGIEVQMDINEPNMSEPTWSSKMKLIFIIFLIIIPIIIMIGSILLLMKKRAGWLISQTSAIFIAFLGFYGSISLSVWILYLIVLIYGAIAIGLGVKTYRDYYGYKMEILLSLAVIALVVLVSLVNL